MKASVLFLFLVTAVAASAQAQNDSAQPNPTSDRKLLTIAPGTTVRYSAPWKISGAQYSNAQELIVPAQTSGATQGTPVESALARILITTEERTSTADALQRLQDIARSRGGTPRVTEIGGWPAIIIEFTEPLPRRGAPQQEQEPPLDLSDRQIQSAIVAVAAGTKVIDFNISLAPGAPAQLLQDAQQIAASSAFPAKSNPEELQRSMQVLQQNLRIAPAQKPRLQSTTPHNESQVRRPSTRSGASTGSLTVQTGNGELEIATSADARNIIIASNTALSYSSNLGASFAAGSTGVFGLNDPTLARGSSGNSYLGVIATANGTPAQLNVSGCTNAVSRSTDNGANFTLRGYSARCPSTGVEVCFPDQEHIAADSVNPSSGNDQLYAVWRNFTPAGTVANCNSIGSGFVTTSISCSQDSGANWTARAAISGAGDFPRVAVGRDGNVYVVRVNGNAIVVNRFGSCASGLTAAPGFPVTVDSLTIALVPCPVSGLDRCNDGNTLSSPTVAPDPGNAAHVFVAFAMNDTEGGETITVAESNDRAATFPNLRSVNSTTSVRRFMPWSCSTHGRAWVGWYDRTAATAPQARNDLTDYFVGSATGFVRGFTYNLTNNPDAQCNSGWPCGERDASSATACPGGAAAPAGNGCPKYGDYNGIACAGNWIIAAWTSATAPRGLPAVAGLSVFSSSVFIGGDGESIWRYTGTPCSGDSCPGWQELDNNSKTTAIASSGGNLYQLHEDGWIWKYTGTPCTLDSCPGWQRLDRNSQTVALAADGSNLYQLHSDGKIWLSTGTPCTGDSCPGWQMLDNNTAGIAIAASGGQLYQMHNTGKIWHYTGTSCSGNVCPGWQMLDNNAATVNIATATGQLYQLHNTGEIWRYTGTACSGTVCPGWQMLDANSKTVAITAGGGSLHQLHNDGMIWVYTGTPCSGSSCPGWRRLDRNPKTISISNSDSGGLFQLHDDGWIWRYTGTPCNGDSCPGWSRVDNNARTGAIAAGNDLYQLHTDPIFQQHSDGSLWRYTGTECDGDFCPGWEELDNNPAARTIAATGRQFFQLNSDGSIWRYIGPSCSGTSCPGWQKLDNNPATVAIAASGNQFFQLHSGDGSIWRFLGTPCNGNSCTSWEKLDNNPRTRAIAAGGNQLFQLHTNGSIWRYVGVPCSGSSCPGWQELDNNPATTQIVSGGNQLFQLHNDGTIWRHIGTPCSGSSCPGWQRLDNNSTTVAIAAGGNQLTQLHNDGTIWRYIGVQCTATSCPGWEELDNNAATRQVEVSGNHIYQRHSDGSIWRYTGPPCNGGSCPGWARLDNNSAATFIAVAGFK